MVWGLGGAVNRGQELGGPVTEGWLITEDLLEMGQFG